MTTHTFMMTTALLGLYAFADEHILDDSGKATDTYATTIPNWTLTFTPSQSIPFEQSIDPASPNFMTWSVPLPFASCTKPTRQWSPTIDSGGRGLALFWFIYNAVLLGDPTSPPTECSSYSFGTPLIANHRTSTIGGR